MRFAKCSFVFGLCLLMGGCPPGPLIEIGDYEYHLDAWNRQNMLDYQLSLEFKSSISGLSDKKATITVRNGIPESSDPPKWLTSGEKSTVLEFFSFIKEEEKRIKKANASKSLHVRYNTISHYPSLISVWPRGGIGESGHEWLWAIKITALGAVNEER